MNNLKKHKVNSSVVIIVAIILVVAVNLFVTVLNEKFPLKIDLTSNKMYEISDKTKEYLKTYDTPVDIYILSSESDQDERISSVLSQYEANENINVTNIKMSENPTFGKKYIADGASLTANSVIVDSGNRFKVFSMTELYGLNAQTGQYTSLNVENKITSALKYVSSDTQLKACMVNGHNELETDGVTEKLKDENFEVSELNTLTEDIPSDASLIMIIRPTVDFSKEEISKIDSYLLSGGNVQFYFDADSKELTNLYTYVKSVWGMGVNDNFVIETDMSQSISLGQNGVTLVVPSVKSTEFTDSIITNKRTIAYFPYSKEITREFEANGDITVTPILTSSSSAYTTANEIVAKTGSEQEGEFIVGAFSQDKKHNSSVYVSGNTMLLTRDPSILANDYGLANYDYLMNLINYSIGNDDSFIVEEKALINNVISVSKSATTVIFLITVILIPAIILACGLVIWIKRRNL